MIKFEHNMLVLNNAFSEADVDEINAFADYVRNQERERIVRILDKLRDSEYSELMTYDELVWFIKDSNNDK